MDKTVRMDLWKRCTAAVGSFRKAPASAPPTAGSGCGPNLRYYAGRVDSIIGVDLNPATLQYAAAAAAVAGLPPGRLRLLVASAEALPLADGSVDAVVGTHVRPGGCRSLNRVVRPSSCPTASADGGRVGAEPSCRPPLVAAQRSALVQHASFLLLRNMSPSWESPSRSSARCLHLPRRCPKCCACCALEAPTSSYSMCAPPAQPRVAPRCSAG